MRYLKVLIAVLLFYVVILFFVQNHGFLSQTMPLKFDLMFLPAQETLPVPHYALMLICFLLGALITLVMLVWDRISISTSLAISNRKVRSLEKDIIKANTASENIKKELATAKDKVVELENLKNEAEAALAKAKDIAAKRADAFNNSGSFTSDMR